MKYIKTYENSERGSRGVMSAVPKVGDYVLFSVPYKDHFSYIYADSSSDPLSSMFPYKVLYVDKNKIIKKYCSRYDFVRKLTQEEINAFELELSVIKYNI